MSAKPHHIRASAFFKLLLKNRHPIDNLLEDELIRLVNNEGSCIMRFYCAGIAIQAYKQNETEDWDRVASMDLHSSTSDDELMMLIMRWRETGTL